MNNIKPYEKYKPSGIEWLGEIPEHWESVKARNVGEFNGSTVDKKIDETQQKIRLINFLDIYNNPKFEIYEKKFMVVSASEHQIIKFKANIGDVVFTPSSELREDIGRSAVVKYEANDLLCSYHVIRMKFYKEIDIDFKKYLFNNHFVLKYFSKVCTGSTRKILTRQNFNNIPLAIPSLPEQTAIAAFLDFKLAKIDRFIRKKKQLIKLLNEQKAAIINQAVTKGISGGKDAMNRVSTKPSGIEWLGDIPEHWEVRKLKYVADFQSGEMITSESIDKEGEYPVFGGGGFRGYTDNFTNDGSHVLIGRQGALCGNIKYANGKFWASEHSIVTYPKIAIETIYLGEILVKCNLGKLSQTAAQPGIAIGQIKNVSIPVPPLPEQLAIVTHIETETAKLNQTISTIEKEITLVQEYKTALIAEAVTGKIDVRNYEIPEIEETESFEEIEEELSMVAEDEVAYETNDMD